MKKIPLYVILSVLFLSVFTVVDAGADRLQEGIWLYEESEQIRDIHYMFRGTLGGYGDYEYYLILTGNRRENDAWGHGVLIGDYLIVFEGGTQFIILKVINDRLCEGERITRYGTVRSKVFFRRID